MIEGRMGGKKPINATQNLFVIFLPRRFVLVAHWIFEFWNIFYFVDSQKGLQLDGERRQVEGVFASLKLYLTNF